MLRTCSGLLGGQERADINTLSIGTPMRSQGSLAVYIDAKFGPTCAAAGQASVGPPLLPTPPEWSRFGYVSSRLTVAEKDVSAPFEPRR